MDPAGPAEPVDLDLPVVAVGGFAAHPRGVVCEAGMTAAGWATAVVDLAEESIDVVQAQGAAPDPAYTPTAEPVTWSGYAVSPSTASSTGPRIPGSPGRRASCRH